MNRLSSRIAFLKLFGHKQRVRLDGKGVKVVELIMCGSDGKVCKVKKLSAHNQMKYLEDPERYEVECTFLEELKNKPIEITVPPPPIGFSWAFKHKKINISGEIISSDPINFTNEYLFRIDKDIILKSERDAAILLNPLDTPIPVECDALWASLLKQTFYLTSPNGVQGLGEFELVRWLIEIGKERAIQKDFRVLKVQNILEQSEQLRESVIWKHILVKVHCDDNSIIIGPVDRMGGKL